MKHFCLQIVSMRASRSLMRMQGWATILVLLPVGVVVYWSFEFGNDGGKGIDKMAVVQRRCLQARYGPFIA